MFRSDKLIYGAVTFFILVLAIILTLVVYHREFDHDEFQHTHIAWCLKGGQQLYSEVLDHHGPLYSYTNAIVWRMMNIPDSIKILFLLRTVNILFMWGVVFLTFVIAQKLFDKKTAWLSIALLLSSYTFLSKALEIRPDIQMNFCFLLGLYFLISTISKQKHSDIFIAALCFIIAIFYNIKVLIPLSIYSLLFCSSKNDKQIAYMFLKLLSALILFSIPFFLFAIHKNILSSMTTIFVKTITTPNLTALHFPLFYSNIFIESIIYTLGGISLLAPNKGLSKLFISLTILNTVIISNLNVFSQWYIMAIPCFSIIVAQGINTTSSIPNFFWKKLLLTCILIIFLCGAISSYYKLMVCPNNKQQIEFTNYILATTTKNDTIFSIWNNHGGYMFRKHAHPQWYGNKEHIYPGLFQVRINQIKESKPNYVLLDEATPEYTTFLQQYFAKTPYPYFWGPRNKELPQRQTQSPVINAIGM